jgi:hypothetical protein
VKLAVFFPASLFSAWCCSYGLVDTLKRMGHAVTALPVQPDNQDPPFGAAVERGLGGYDGIVIAGPEHIARGVRPNSGRLPTVAWLHETVEREDYGKLDVDAIKRTADIVFCPGKQDEKYGFRYLPFGVDTEIFKPTVTKPGVLAPDDSAAFATFEDVAPRKSIDAAFIGLLYPKRQAFLKELKAQGINLVTGNVQVLELGGINPRETAELYAENLRKIKVFVNLPTLSQLAVTKIYEALACGTPVLTPKIEHMENLEGLPTAVSVYRDARECANFIRLSLDAKSTGDPFRRGRSIATEIQAKHSLELRCQVMIDALKEIGAKAA